MKKNIDLMNNLAILIRYSGERSFELSKYAIEQQLSPISPIEVISSWPFEDTLIKSYEAALRLNKEYTLMVDADTIALFDSVNKLMQTAHKTKPFITQGLIYDNIFSKYRRAGHHLYRTELLARAVKYIPKKGQYLRPESFVIKKILQEGEKKLYTNILFGVHDFEQYFADLYRKSVNHGHKHQYLWRELEEALKSNSIEDERNVISLGFFEGMTNSRHFSLNSTLDVQSIKNRIYFLGISERKDIKDSEFYEIINNLTMKMYLKIEKQKPKLESFLDLQRKRIQKFGIKNGLLSSIISYLETKMINTNELN